MNCLSCVNASPLDSSYDRTQQLSVYDNEGYSAQFGLVKKNRGDLSPCPVADVAQMNFTQMHERLRVELLRRIERGTVSVSLLARQTGFGKSHLSNFLHNRGQLSLEAMDRMLAAQHLAAADLLPATCNSSQWRTHEESGAVPLVSHNAALFDPHIRPTAVQSMLHLPPKALNGLRSRATPARRAWQRFVAVRISPSDALPMDPLVLPEALAVIDRHYNSLIPYRPSRPNLCAVRDGAHLTLRYADYLSTRLVLRPLSIKFPVDLIELGPAASPGEYIAGRVVLIINEP